MSAGDKTKALDAVTAATKWLDTNQTAEKEEFEEKQKEVERVIAPILQNLSGGSAAGNGGGSASAGPAAEADEGPKIEEID
eukprot:gene10980-biopygen9038